MSLLSFTSIEDKKEREAVKGRIKCPFCMNTGNRRSVVFKTQKQFKIHICTHTDFSERERMSVRRYATEYFMMRKMGMVQ